MSVKKTLKLPVFAEKGGEDLFARQRRRQWEIAAGDPLGEAENIRAHAFMLAGEHLSRAAEAGRHFVENKENPIFSADLTQRLHIAQRLGPHTPPPLHQN